MEIQENTFLNPVLWDIKIKELQSKKLSFDEFTKLQRIVLEMYENFFLKSNNWEMISNKFKFLMGKSFPDSRDTILRSKNPGDVTALAVKIARNRPEVYLLFHSGKGEFDIFDEALFDAYSNDMYIKPDWKVFWPLI